MNIFISHSSQDTRFVRQLADSLEFYGLHVFLDDRKIKPGDNISAEIYKGLQHATHVIVVLSQNSISSKWMKEELSVAKMRQMADTKCRIIPALIENVDLPTELAHIKCADFRHWEIKEAYLDGLQALLSGLKIRPNYRTSAEMKYLLAHLPQLTIMLAFANTVAQAFFQLERLWFELLGRDPARCAYWLQESVYKNPEKERFQEAVQKLTETRAALRTEAPTADKVLELCSVLQKELDFWLEGSCTALTQDQAYQQLWEGQSRGYELSTLVLSVSLELSKRIVLPPQLAMNE